MYSPARRIWRLYDVSWLWNQGRLIRNVIPQLLVVVDLLRCVLPLDHALLHCMREQIEHQN
jgi:hypothetical protein